MLQARGLISLLCRSILASLVRKAGKVVSSQSFRRSQWRLHAGRVFDSSTPEGHLPYHMHRLRSTLTDGVDAGAACLMSAPAQGIATESTKPQALNVRIAKRLRVVRIAIFKHFKAGILCNYEMPVGSQTILVCAFLSARSSASDQLKNHRDQFISCPSGVRALSGALS